MFLTTMAESGRISIPHPSQDPSNLRELLEEDVIAREAVHRLELVESVPAFNVTAATWASGILYRSCQFLVYRDVDAETVKRLLSERFDGPVDAAVSYSVDVAFCYLPDVFHLAKGISHDDPLVMGLREIARAWPLSSVGIAELGEIDVAAFIDDACLRELYTQRILQRKDRSRLGPPEIRLAIREAIGAYPELAPELVNALSKEEIA